MKFNYNCILFKDLHLLTLKKKIDMYIGFLNFENVPIDKLDTVKLIRYTKNRNNVLIFNSKCTCLATFFNTIKFRKCVLLKCNDGIYNNPYNFVIRYDFFSDMEIYNEIIEKSDIIVDYLKDSS